ncbi:uncharacterized protein LOC135203947 [Macrobrachium nipponense]|uniref:uncharacterized protein LOC135203947 n=1 Tax=Macrobrachium nipponense TaxID=159736 RepID=UPI0030C86B56
MYTKPVILQPPCTPNQSFSSLHVHQTSHSPASMYTKPVILQPPCTPKPPPVLQPPCITTKSLSSLHCTPNSHSPASMYTKPVNSSSLHVHTKPVILQACTPNQSLLSMPPCTPPVILHPPGTTKPGIHHASIRPNQSLCQPPVHHHSLSSLHDTPKTVHLLRASMYTNQSLSSHPMSTPNQS